MNGIVPTPAIERALASLLENPRNEAVWARFRRVVLMEAGRVRVAVPVEANGTVEKQ